MGWLRVQKTYVDGGVGGWQGPPTNSPGGASIFTLTLDAMASPSFQTVTWYATMSKPFAGSGRCVTSTLRTGDAARAARTPLAAVGAALPASTTADASASRRLAIDPNRLVKLLSRILMSPRNEPR